MKASEFKEYLLEDVERIEKVLESIGCHKIWRTGDEVRSAPPDGENHTSVSVNLDNLFCRVYTEGETWRGDILSLVQYYRKESFSDSFRFLRSVFGLKGGKFVKDNRVDPLSAFKSIRKQHKVIKDINELDVPKFGMEAMDGFVIMPHMSLFYEGITTQTQELFKIAYDPQSDRIVFPHFSWDDINLIVGLTGRTLRTDIEMKEFNIPKYWNFIRGYKKMYNLYGFSHSLPFIIKNNTIVIFEAEKSVQKHFSMTRNEGFGVSVGGHELSHIQAQIILQNTPSDVEVVIAFDRDVQDMKDDDGKPIGEEYLANICRMFSKYRKASYIWDTYGILGEKSSPVDHGVKIWNHLFKYRKEVK